MYCIGVIHLYFRAYTVYRSILMASSDLKFSLSSKRLQIPPFSRPNMQESKTPPKSISKSEATLFQEDIKSLGFSRDSAWRMRKSAWRQDKFARIILHIFSWTLETTRIILQPALAVVATSAWIAKSARDLIVSPAVYIKGSLSEKAWFLVWKVVATSTSRSGGLLKLI